MLDWPSPVFAELIPCLTRSTLVPLRFQPSLGAEDARGVLDELEVGVERREEVDRQIQSSKAEKD